MQQSATLIAIVHILIAFFLVVIVLLQDSKGGAGGSFGGGSSQSLFGATGTASFMVKLTRYLAVGFMFTCIALTIIAAKSSNKSVVDTLTSDPLTVPPKATPIPTAPEGKK